MLSTYIVTPSIFAPTVVIAVARSVLTETPVPAAIGPCFAAS